MVIKLLLVSKNFCDEAVEYKHTKMWSKLEGMIT